MVTDKDRATSDGTAIARPGQIWVCSGCGKRSRTRYGFDSDGHRQSVDRGWDVSCMFNAVLCYDPPIDGRYRAVNDEGDDAT